MPELLMVMNCNGWRIVIWRFADGHQEAQLISPDGKTICQGRM
jgi:hypothetical protein